MDEAITRRALELLGCQRNDAYEAALAALGEDTQGWWEDVLARGPDELGEGEEHATADAQGLRRFLRPRYCHGSKIAGRNWPTVH
jgi:hypothetical protein